MSKVAMRNDLRGTVVLGLILNCLPVLCFGGDPADREANAGGMAPTSVTDQPNEFRDAEFGIESPVTSALGATATIRLWAVNPPGGLPGAVPNALGQALYYPGTAQRAWFNIQVMNWDSLPTPQNLKTAQVKINSAGYDGSVAAPASGVDVSPAWVSCTSNIDCRNAFQGGGAICGAGEASRCRAAANFNVTGTFCPFASCCEPGYQNFCDPKWILSGVSGAAAVDYSTPNFRYGLASTLPDVCPDLGPSHMGTLVLDIPADARSTYTIGYILPETFLFDDSTPISLPIPIASLTLGQVTPAWQNRYLPLPGLADLCPGAAATPVHVTIRLVLLPQFPVWNGVGRIVGIPASKPDVSGTFMAAATRCTVLSPAHVCSEFAGVQVYGKEIVPGSLYRVEVRRASDNVLISQRDLYTEKWGDVVAPFGAGQPNFVDVSAIASAFQEKPNSIRKARAQLQPATPSPGAGVNFLDVSSCVGAFQQKPYPYSGPSCCGAECTAMGELEPE